MKNEHKVIHFKFKQFGANSKMWMRKCVLLLLEIDRYRIWEQKEFGSIYEYAAKLSGMGHEMVNISLRILKKTEHMPAIRKVIESKGIGIIRPIENILLPENEKFWAEKAMQMSKNTLETYVRELKKQEQVRRPGSSQDDDLSHKEAISIFNSELEREGCDIVKKESMLTEKMKIESSEFTQELSQEEIRLVLGKSSGNSCQQTLKSFEEDALLQSETPVQPKVTLVMQVDPQVADQLQKLQTNGGWNELMKNLLKIRETQLEEAQPEPVQTESRHIPNKIQKFVKARTNGVCAYAGCEKTLNILHHTHRFALEKTHDSNSIEALCKAHERIVHLGLVANEELSAVNWQVRLHHAENGPKFKVDELVAKYRNGRSP